jgi:N-acylneuraminate cytidylyltransferase
MIVGLIPARGGRKGIPRKNLRKLRGKSLIEIGVNLLFSAGCEQVYVSSEDNEILQVAELAGGKVLKRPRNLSMDESSTESVILHAIHNLNLKMEDILVTHQVTSPLIRLQSVNKCIKMLLEDEKINSTISVYETHPFLWLKNGNDTWEPQGHSRANRKPRQNMGTIGHETGGIYVSRVQPTLEQKTRFPKPTKCISVDYLEALDIDNFGDLENAECLFNLSLK